MNRRRRLHRRRLGPRKMTPANISEACISPRTNSYRAYIIIALREFFLRFSFEKNDNHISIDIEIEECDFESLFSRS